MRLRSVCLAGSFLSGSRSVVRAAQSPRPLASFMHGLDAATLRVVTRAGADLTVRQVARLAGTGTLASVRLPLLRLVDIGLIAPELRGRGLAHDLVGNMIQQARRLGASELILNVIIGNEPAIRAYERAGFVNIAESSRPDVRSMTRKLEEAAR